ncbi:MAG TPA: glycosyltransferase [Puia sp.]|nr:glycosyltransferase [Puia sp.]
MSRILWLASWYPNKTDPYTGDFIRRQAIAVSAFHETILIFVTKYINTGRSQPDYELPPVDGNYHLKEHLSYYRETESVIPFYSALHSLLQYFKAHLRLFRELKLQENLPEIVHVQVAMKAGLIAWYLKRKYGIPFVITEHWSGYVDNGPDPLKSKSFLFRFLLKKILREAACFLPVSENLRDAVQQKAPGLKTRIIPNVVDTSLFNEDDHSNPQRFRFIHVSSIHPLKNVDSILSAFERLIESGIKADLVIVGPAPSELQHRVAGNPRLKDQVYFTGEVSYEEVAAELKKSDAFVLFSKTENLPCVILEALCCGIPVISTRVGGIASIVDSSNGLLVEPSNEQALTSAMATMISTYSQYDKKQISRKSQALFSYQTVGQEISQVYAGLLNQQVNDGQHIG